LVSGVAPAGNATAAPDGPTVLAQAGSISGKAGRNGQRNGLTQAGAGWQVYHPVIVRPALSRALGLGQEPPPGPPMVQQTIKP
jgi:hypothetical protein